MQGNENFQDIYDKITTLCLGYFRGECSGSIFDLTTVIMSLKNFPIHHPAHHYLVPAVLLTFCRRAQGQSIEVIERDLDLAQKRAKVVQGGSCGYFGACGAAVGVGIFWCVITDCSPLSTDSWSYGNRATGHALMEMAYIGGPRCCKRCTYISLQSATAQIEEILHIKLDMPQQYICSFSSQNLECIHEHCTFYEVNEENV